MNWTPESLEGLELTGTQGLATGISPDGVCVGTAGTWLLSGHLPL